MLNSTHGMSILFKDLVLVISQIFRSKLYLPHTELSKTIPGDVWNASFGSFVGIIRELA